MKSKNLLFWSLPAFLANVLVIFYGFNNLQISSALEFQTIFSARIAFAYFLIAYGIGIIYKIFKVSFFSFLRSERRYIGLGFCLAHTIHLISLVYYLIFIDFFPGWLLIVFGGLGYILMYVMAVTSHDRMVEKLRLPLWKKIHSFGINYLAIIFAYVYLIRVLSKEMIMISSLFLLLIVSLMILRVGENFLAKREIQEAT